MQPRSWEPALVAGAENTHSLYPICFAAHQPYGSLGNAQLTQTRQLWELLGEAKHHLPGNYLPCNKLLRVKHRRGGQFTGLGNLL
jgi:hypothetical protein